jgi:hypothetical protein
VINAFGALEAGSLDTDEPPMWGIHGSQDTVCFWCPPSKISIIPTTEVSGTLGAELADAQIPHDLRVVTPAPGGGQPDGGHGAANVDFLAAPTPTQNFLDFVLWLESKIYPDRCCGGG